MSARIIEKVICPPTVTKLRRQFFCPLNPNDFVPFVPCHHLLAKAVAIPYQVLDSLYQTQEQQTVYLNQPAEKEQQQR